MAKPAVTASKTLLGQKELLLLFIMMAATDGQFSPSAAKQTADNILNLIQADYNVGRATQWNWDNVGRANALDLATAAVADPNSYQATATDFQQNLPATLWDPSDPDHPKISELKTMLGLT